MTKLVIDGVPVTVADDQSGAIIERHIKSLTDQLKAVNDGFEDFKKKKKDSDKECADAKALVDARDGEIIVLKKAVADAAITPEMLDVRVKDRLAVLDKAKTILDEKYVFDGKSVEAIRKDAVTVKLGDAVVKHLNDGAIEGAFLAIDADSKSATNATKQIGDALRHRPHSASNITDAVEKAHDEMVTRLQDAWKTPSAA